MFKKRKKDIKGTILFEVVLSVGILATLASAAAMIIVSSLYANSFNRNSLVAVNLARDGIEIVRNIRDTNWLKYSTEIEDKWDIYNVDEDKRYENDGARYIPIFDVATRRYYLDLINSSSDPFDLDYDDLKDDEKAAANVRLKDFDGTDIYTNTTDGAGEGTLVYREVALVCVDIAGVNCNEYEIVSSVQWKERGKTRTVDLVSGISNYLK